MRTDGMPPQLQAAVVICRLVSPRTAVIQEEQKRVVASPKRSALIRLVQQGVNLALFEVTDRRLGGLLERN
jgi:hypothetical protein